MSWYALVSVAALAVVLCVVNVHSTHDEDIRELELRSLLRNLDHVKTLSLDTIDNNVSQEDLVASKRRRWKMKPKKMRKWNKWQQKLLNRKRKACERSCFRGQCVATEDGDVGCVCYEGWMGSNCDIGITVPPATSLPPAMTTTVAETSMEESTEIEEAEETRVCNKSTCQHGVFVQSACVCDGEWGGLNCNKYAPCLGANATGQYYFPHSKDNCFIQCSQFGESFVNCCAEGLIWSQQILGCIRNTIVVTENSNEDLDVVGSYGIEDVIKEIEELIQDIEEENGGPTDETIAAQNAIDDLEEQINEIEEENPEPETEGMTEDDIKDVIEEEIEQEIEHEIESETGSEIDDETKVEIEQEIEHQIEDGNWNKTSSEELEEDLEQGTVGESAGIDEEILVTGTEDEMEQEIESEIEQEIEDGADGPIDEQTKHEIEDEIVDILVDQMTSEENITEIEAEFENENEVDVEEQLSEEIDKQTGGNIDNETKQEIEDMIEEVIEELEPESESGETEIEIDNGEDNGTDSSVIDESEEVVVNVTEVVTVPTTTVIQLRCPLASKHGGALHIYDDTCYKFVEVERSWNEAATDCVSQGGQLVKVKGQSHNDWIVETAINALGWKFNGMWIGARKDDDDWLWSQGEPLDYSNWARGYPRRWSGKCANIRFDKQGQWENKRCEHPLRSFLPYDYSYICEYEMEPFTRPTGGMPETTTHNAMIPDNFDYLCDESDVLYHPHPTMDDAYIQCDNWGQATVMPCAPGTKWEQAELTCIDMRFATSRKRHLIDADKLSILKRIIAKYH